MRIGVIAHLKYPISGPYAGGLEMHTAMLVRGLRARGHDVTLFATEQSNPSLLGEAISRQTAMDELGTAEISDVVFFREHHAYLDLMMRLRSASFDIVHNNSLHYLPVSMAGCLPMPMVTTLHTPPFGWLESGIRVSAASNDGFVAVSNAIARGWSSIVPHAHVIHNGIDLNNFQFVADPDPDDYLIWFGRIVPEKGLACAIDAACATDSSLVIAGPISDRDYFDTFIWPRLNDRIRYAGHLDHLTLARLVGPALGSSQSSAAFIA